MSWEEDDQEYESIGEVEIISESAKALKVKRKDGKIAWLPKSVVSDESEASSTGDKGELFVAKWFYEKEGL